MVRAKCVDHLAQQMGTGRGVGRYQLRKSRTQLHVDVVDARFLLLHLAELGGPGHLARRFRRRHAQQSGVVREKVDVC